MDELIYSMTARSGEQALYRFEGDAALLFKISSKIGDLFSLHLRIQG